ncbi:MAG: protein-glutamate O-methyltransferase [Paludibacteraceae bacterium]|nr:protein-glutamate O-methyltransferase [Paludibacteraceae bacterium]MBP5368340.1 protein-glutamate O-methyltransferase [Bacteroidales bacterium]
MQQITTSSYYDARLSSKDFARLSDFIYSRYGIKMPEAKHIMLQSRLQKRLRALQIPDFSQYVDFVFSPAGVDEIVHMMDVVSTNKTDFFREAQHFDFLTQTVLPEIYEKERQPMIKVWSAGCSSGEEPYTLAMVISEYISKHRGCDFSILGSDLSTIVLEKAVTAIYPEDRVDIIPLDLKKKYLLRSKDRTKPTVRIVPELRARTSFMRLNFMDEAYNAPSNFDIIFCRNVLIYFDRQTQEKVINKLCRHLRPGGYFFLGHSESVTGINVPLKQIMPTVFKLNN